jgi:hypothetical protein
MIYVTREDWGCCKGCGHWRDRRYGYCYECCIEAELEKGLISQEEYQKELKNLTKLRNYIKSCEAK